MRTGAECIMEALEKAGVKTIFGLPGGSVLDIFAQLYHAPFEFILSRHEQGATHMADGYARATGRVGCCVVTSGPGNVKIDDKVKSGPTTYAGLGQYMASDAMFRGGTCWGYFFDTTAGT